MKDDAFAPLPLAVIILTCVLLWGYLFMFEPCASNIGPAHRCTAFLSGI